ncbi:hypothetical protein, partial [Candidatus Enterovibrio escicola]
MEQKPVPRSDFFPDKCVQPRKTCKKDGNDKEVKSRSKLLLNTDNWCRGMQIVFHLCLTEPVTIFLSH